MALSYLDRVVKFQKLIRQEKLKSSVRTVYMSFLDIFNEYGWKKQIRITYNEIQFVANLSLNSIKRAIIELKELELMDYRSKQGSKYIFIHLDGLIPEDTSYDDLVKMRAKSKKKYVEPSEPDDTPIPTSSPGPKGGVIRRQPPSNETYSPDGDHPPDDGLSRNWDDLKRNLSELNIPPGDYQKIVQLSNYGQIGHPVWKAFHEIGKRKGSKDAVKNPGAWIQWYINENPPSATAPVAPAPSPPPETPEMPELRPPDDGVERDWEVLKSRLEEMRCTWRGIHQIAELSGYGKTGSPVWDALEKVRDRKDKDIPPGAWIIEYLNKNTS
ncbi:hypothetical protein [Dysgonomonas termitidis]|uniref:Helix-turn-helix domain-containing protein n=1 Tax=Dysgonomonas termitidis TaxID=1516126 RepID=A0ABV9KVA8_9BACT